MFLVRELGHPHFSKQSILARHPGAFHRSEPDLRDCQALAGGPVAGCRDRSDPDLNAFVRQTLRRLKTICSGR